MCLKINDDNSSPKASISILLQKLGMSKSQKKSTFLFNELKTAIGWEPSTVFCRKVKPDVPAYNSKYPFNLGFKTISSFMFKGSANDTSLLVIFMLLLPV